MLHKLRRSSSESRRLPIRRTLMLGAVAGSAFLGLATQASAAPSLPVNLNFNAVNLTTPGTGSQWIVSPSGAPVMATANVTPTSATTASFTISPGQWNFPTYNMVKPVPGSVSIGLKGPANGTVDFTTGAVSVNADLVATINITGYGSCTKDTGPITMTTGTTSPLNGAAFPAGQAGVATGTGAFGAGWATLAPGTGPACSTLVDPAVDGPGGVWFARVQPVTMKASTLKVKHKKSGTLKVKVTNKGTGDTGTDKVCLQVPKGLKGSTCKNVDVAAGAAKTVSFKVKAGAKKHSYKATVTATSLGVALGTKNVTIKVH